MDLARRSATSSPAAARRGCAAARPAVASAACSCSARSPPTAAAAPQQWQRRAPSVAARAAAGRGGGSGLLDADTLTNLGRAAEPAKKKPPIYKVMLHNDDVNRRDYVCRVLLKVVEGFTMEDAVAVMQEAHETGVALVVACDQDRAEGYVESLRLNGLISTMEPGH